MKTCLNVNKLIVQAYLTKATFYSLHTVTLHCIMLPRSSPMTSICLYFRFLFVIMVVLRWISDDGIT